MTNAVACPEPETIAAYLDSRLSPEDRVRVEEHLADCEECRALVSETARFLELGAEGAAAAAGPVDVPPPSVAAASVAAASAPAAPTAGRPSRTPWLAGLAAAAAVAALTPIVLRQTRPTPEAAMAELDRALAGHRYVRARVAGLQYGTPVSPTRSAADGADSVPLAARAAAAKVERLVGASEDADALAALGAARLATGRIADAVAALEHAARLDPRDANVQSDLAAAYLERSAAGGDDVVRAVEAAQRAQELDARSGAAAFNLALALERQGRADDAVRAWKRYLELDAASPWSSEARAELAGLSKGTR